MPYLFACFVFYSFIGFLLEVLYSRLTRSHKLDRKCFLLSPLCPVYGFSAVALILLPSWIVQSPPLFFLAGGLTATIVEYCTGLFYERGVGVQFWNYASLPGNISGRICVLFSFFWSILACFFIYVLHPAISNILSQVPLILLQFLFLFLSVDGIISLILLHKTSSTDILKWYTFRPQTTG
jgi:uncharacterized membrane protein